MARPPGDAFQLGIVVGIFITLFVNKLIQGCGDEAWNTSLGWRWMLGIGAVPAVFFMLLLLGVPESPRWLAQNSREDEARQILSRAAGAVDAEKQMTEIREAIGQEEGRFSELFGGRLLPSAGAGGRAHAVLAVLRHQRHHLLLDRHFQDGRGRQGRGLRGDGLDRA